ncbi:AMP-binding protein [Micromonospora sp. WMMD1082]|uniref:(2,3-dihydroxybenzoyl)adenylate synthase n=1 Tax=Micromonospora sp. WMMD1082 TaxID=3016104 RepID=UPI002417278B|nr:AMP-binding protein [Micromonospora sp. WMMD1082]MDG4792770.1 AMP-binding protein [Micromonospora sp. WMMD1082]
MHLAQPSVAGTVPWPADLAAGYRRDGYWEGRPLVSYLQAAADATPDAVCLVDGELRLSYRELMARVDGAALRLRDLGLRPDDRIVLQLPNCWEFIVLTLACARLGLLPVMALSAYRQQEISTLVEIAQARAVAVARTVKGFDHEAMAHDIAGTATTLSHVLVIDPVRRDSVDLRELVTPAGQATQARAELDAGAPDSSAVALFLLSGGTTGLPKLIPRTHDDFAYMARRAARLCGLGPETTYLAVLPLGHGYPMSGPGVLGTLMSGGRVVLAESPEPSRAFALIEQERITMTSLVPAVVQRWLEHRAADQSADLRTLRLVQVAGSRLPDEVAARIAPALGCTLQQVYGMAEGLLCLTRLDDPAEVRCHTQGRPISPGDELLVVDEDGVPVPAGRPGELLTRGPYTPRGYYRDPQRNAQAFTPDGWYRTGDVVRIRPDGNLVIEGRTKDLINRGGEKISAEEVEGYAYQLATVSLAAAVAMPDPELGERVCLYVVPHSGAEVALDDVRQVMREAGVAPFKLPERIVLVDSLPTTAVGKIDKKNLRARLA